jgi:hypothetical protein
MILQLNSEPLAKEVGLLRISIHMVTPILRQIVEFLTSEPLAKESFDTLYSEAG